MNLQTVLASSAAALAAFYFIRGIVQDFSVTSNPAGSSCGKCSAGGCPAARKD
jgi:hypothetical protein